MRKRHSFRGEKLGEEIRRILSELLARDLKDPVFGGMISVSYVKSTNDGSFATVYFTSMNDTDAADIEAGFEKAKGFIRNEISRRLGIRRAPDLRFKADEAERYGRHIDTLLDALDLPDSAGKEPRAVTFDEISNIIDAYERYLIFTHVHMDGDTLGAAVAFAESMREIGREAWVLVSEEVPRTLALLNASFVVGVEGAPESDVPTLAIAMDFASEERIEACGELFKSTAESLSIDHHAISKSDCDYYYLESEAAATSEIVYRFLKFAQLPVTERIATALYIGIVTDTGRFQYKNTTPGTHRIAAELIEAGADFNAVYQNIYQNVRAEKLLMQSEMLDTLDIFAGGKAAIAFVRADTLVQFDAGEDETDGMSEVLRSIIGVEVAIFLKELPAGQVKASMRSKEWFDVSVLAAEFGGGGHKRAAGFTSGQAIESLCAALKTKLETALK